VETSKQNIDLLLPSFPSLKHVKTGKKFKGVILLKDNTLVAVLQCNLDTGYIVALEVSPEFQRKGIATKLLKVAQNLGCFKLSVNVKNLNAQNLYEKEGYKEIKREGKMIFMECKE
jgi:ribosomal protein S18 acetylase RimI-like enzyme